MTSRCGGLGCYPLGDGTCRSRSPTTYLTTATIGIHLLLKPKMPFSLLPAVYARSALPSVEDWGGRVGGLGHGDPGHAP